MRIPFFKYQGTGNDFVIIDQRVNKYITAEDQALIEQMCDRRFGIGADGLMLIEPSEQTDFEMVYFNADGRTSSMCGNGGRCIVSLAAKLGVFADQCTFDAIDGVHEARVEKDGSVALKMNNVSTINKDQEAYVLDTGSPHYVRFEQRVNTLDMVHEGRSVRFSEMYKENGINVNLVEWQDDVLQVRTYERGVEDETFSCGTGVVASALSLAQKVESITDQVNILTKGGKLKVSFEKIDGAYYNIWLIGPATYVYEGTFTTV